MILRHEMGLKRVRRVSKCCHNTRLGAKGSKLHNKQHCIEPSIEVPLAHPSKLFLDFFLALG